MLVFIYGRRVEGLVVIIRGVGIVNSAFQCKFWARTRMIHIAECMVLCKFVITIIMPHHNNHYFVVMTGFFWFCFG